MVFKLLKKILRKNDTGIQDLNASENNLVSKASRSKKNKPYSNKKRTQTPTPYSAQESLKDKRKRKQTKNADLKAYKTATPSQEYTGHDGEENVVYKELPFEIKHSQKNKSNSKSYRPHPNKKSLSSKNRFHNDAKYAKFPKEYSKNTVKKDSEEPSRYKDNDNVGFPFNRILSELSSQKDENAQKTENEVLEVSPATSILDTTLHFKDLGIEHPYLLAKLAEQNFKHPTEVQAKAIPVAIKGDNLVCSSFTGSGKTIAFVLPILEKLIKKEIYQAVILLPTREIAMQIQKVVDAFLPYGDITCGLVVGGSDMNEQRRILRNYPEIFIATPGRLVHAIQEGWVWLNYTGLVVLDEMDRMLDMGFKDQLDIIYNEFPKLETENETLSAHTPKDNHSETSQTSDSQPPHQIQTPHTKIQMLTFTATLLPTIQKTIDGYMKTYQKVVIGDGINVNKNIDHRVFKVHYKDKFRALEQLLKILKGKKTIVFFNRIEDTIKFAAKIRKNRSHNVLSLHSRKSQEERNHALNDFRNGKTNLLFATDVAARGIDVYRIEYVINYSVPQNAEEYIHRIGRTGRMNLKGYAFTFFEDKEIKSLKSIEKLLGKRMNIEEVGNLKNV